MSISAEEFEALNLQLIDLKTAKYESQDREKKLNNEIKQLKEHVASLENDLKKASHPDPGSPFSFSGTFGSKNKDKIAALASENEALSRNLELATQEHKEQQEAMMQNVKNLYASNKALEEEIESYKKSIQEKDRKIESQEVQLRKLQVQILQFETSANIHAPPSPSLSTPSPSAPSPATSQEITGSEEEGKGENGEVKEEGEGEEKKNEGKKNKKKNKKQAEANHAIGALEEENARLRENVRLLSTQMRELDDQLSKSEESSRTQISTLEQQLVTFREKIKQDEIATARMEARLEEELSRVLKDKEELVLKMSSLEEQGKKDKSSLDLVDGLKEEIADLGDKLSIMKTSRDDYMEQAKKLTAECESVSQAKNTLQARLHELETEVDLLRKVRDQHSVTLVEGENMKAQISTLTTSLDRANAECAELSESKKELERIKAELEKELEHVKKELEEVTNQRNALQAELEELKKECENLRTENSKLAPLEQEVDAVKLARLQAVTESSHYKEQYEAAHQKVLSLQNSVEDLTRKFEQANEEVTTLTSKVTQLETQMQDRETEFKIQERKSQRMVKELKAELQKERTTLARSVSMDQMSLTVPPSPVPSSTNQQRHSPPMSPVPLTPPSTHHHQHSTPHHNTPRSLSRQQSDAINSLPLLSSSVSNMELSHSTMEEILRRDLETALTTVGKLGEDKWKLEEKTRFLEENIASLNEDLVRKTQVIRYYVTKTKQIVTPEHLATAEREKLTRKQSGVLGTLVRSGADRQELSAELLSKMEAILEETVLKNIQLQSDMVTLANETGQLQKSVNTLKDENKQLAIENHHYKDQLVRLTSNPH